MRTRIPTIDAVLAGAEKGLDVYDAWASRDEPLPPRWTPDPENVTAAPPSDPRFTDAFTGGSGRGTLPRSGVDYGVPDALTVSRGFRRAPKPGC